MSLVFPDCVAAPLDGNQFWLFGQAAANGKRRERQEGHHECGLSQWLYLVGPWF